MNNLIKSLAKLAKVSDVEAFAEALRSETDTDYQLDIDNFIIRTKDEEEAFKNNITTEVKNKAFSDAFEIKIKNLKKDLGLEFEGKKDEDFINAFKNKILEEAKIEPNNRINELENTLKNTTNILKDKELEFEKMKNQFNLEKNRLKAESLIPELPETFGIKTSEAADLFFLKHEIKDDGVYREGVRLVDTKTAEPLTLETAVSGFVSERGWAKVPQGRGGGSGNPKPTGSISSLQDFDNLAREKGYNIGSKEYNALLADIAKENPEILG